MTAIDLAALETTLDALPKAFPGPGGLVGVVKDGKIVSPPGTKGESRAATHPKPSLVNINHLK